VRRPEARCVEAPGNPISIADLSAAAGVSKSALYLAFHLSCGEPQLEHFRKRRLTQAQAGIATSSANPCLSVWGSRSPDPRQSEPPANLWTRGLRNSSEDSGLRKNGPDSVSRTTTFPRA